MELKYVERVRLCRSLVVLIVPLWNWNTERTDTVQSKPTSSNRTFMELKSPCPSELSRIRKVLIVPLWNWNAYLQKATLNPLKVLIVPLWNWNDTERAKMLSRACSNRTFMELKSRCCVRCSSPKWVLIVPLWNWNR